MEKIATGLGLSPLPISLDSSLSLENFTKNHHDTPITVAMIDALQDLAAEKDGQRTAIIFFTSGTTSGKPKGCPRSVSQLTACALDTSSVYWKDRWRPLVVTPGFRVIVCALAIGILRLGQCMIVSDRLFNLERAIDAIETHKADSMLVSPALASMFAADRLRNERDYSSMRGVWIGGDIASMTTVRLAKQAFENAEVVAIFGMTEGFGFFGTPDPIEEPLEGTEIVSVGRPQPGSSFRIVEDGKVVPRVEIGELHLSGPFQITQYLGNADPEHSTRTDDNGSSPAIGQSTPRED